MAKFKSNIIETSNINALLFGVEKVPFTDFQANSDYSHQIIAYPNMEREITVVNNNGEMVTETVKEPTKLLVNACSDRYNLIPNSEIFVPIRNMLQDAKIKFNESYKIINNARFYGSYSFMEKGIEVESGDIIFPKLNIGHSYNGLTKYIIQFGYFRLICSNGLVVPYEGTKELNLSYKGKHTLLLNHRLEELLERINIFTNKGKDVTQSFKDMTDRWIKNPNDRITEVLNANKIRIVETKDFSTLNFINNIIQAETNQLHRNDKVNDWHIYNGINQYLFKNDRINDAPEISAEKDSAVLNWLIANPV